MLTPPGLRQLLTPSPSQSRLRLPMCTMMSSASAGWPAGQTAVGFWPTEMKLAAELVVELG